MRQSWRGLAGGASPVTIMTGREEEHMESGVCSCVLLGLAKGEFTRVLGWIWWRLHAMQGRLVANLTCTYYQEGRWEDFEWVWLSSRPVNHLQESTVPGCFRVSRRVILIAPLLEHFAL